MHKIVQDLYVNTGGILNSDGSAHLIEDNVIVLNLHGDEVFDTKINVYDSITAMQMQGFLLHHEHAVENLEAKVELRNRRAFYLYTNGNFETLI